MFNREELLNKVLPIVMTAGQKVLKVYNNKRIKMTAKADQSPQTEADMISHQIITAGLAALNLDIPILSEESIDPENFSHEKLESYWLIDPLDGTKEFLNRNGEFTINVALIENQIPTLGIVYAPAIDICYYAASHLGAYKMTGNSKPIPININSKKTNEPIIVISHYEKNPHLDAALKKIGQHAIVRMGSSIKICLVAEGEADLYPRLFPTYIWDTAAAHCVLLEAGGDLYDVQNKIPLRYDVNAALLNPNFLALGKNISLIDFF